MDNQILKYRFGITLELEPSLYIFQYYSFIGLFQFQTTCQWLKKFILDSVPGFAEINKNIFFTNQLFDWQQALYYRSVYWPSVDYICNQIPVSKCYNL